MQKKFMAANIILLLIIIILLEAVSFLVLKNRLGDFDLATQGGTTMVKSAYQVWEHPENYQSWSGKTEFNNLGFRHREDLTITKPPGVVRIFLMGGSAAFGSQAMPGSVFLQLSRQGEYANEETITAYLQQKLNEKYPHKTFQVINAATNWSRLHQQMLHYLRKIRNMEPDLILSMDAYNDSTFIHSESTWKDTVLLANTQLYGNLKHKLTPLFQNSYSAYLLAMMLFRTGETPPLNQALLDQYTGVPIPSDFDANIGKSRVENAKPTRLLVNEYINNMKYFNAVLKEDQVPHIFYLQPLAILDQYKTLTSTEIALRGYQYDTLNSSQFDRINFFNEIKHAGARLKADGVLDFESMLDIFAGEIEDIYSDYCHFTPRGNQLIAAYFLNEIETKYPELVR